MPAYDMVKDREPNREYGTQVDREMRIEMRNTYGCTHFRIPVRCSCCGNKSHWVDQTNLCFACIAITLKKAAKARQQAYDT